MINQTSLNNDLSNLEEKFRYIGNFQNLQNLDNDIFLISNLYIKNCPFCLLTQPDWKAFVIQMEKYTSCIEIKNDLNTNAAVFRIRLLEKKDNMKHIMNMINIWMHYNLVRFCDESYNPYNGRGNFIYYTMDEHSNIINANYLFDVMPLSISIPPLCRNDINNETLLKTDVTELTIDFYAENLLTMDEGPFSPEQLRSMILANN